jgi:hypothetical protein
MIASIFITILVLPSLMFHLMNVAVTGGYKGRVPGGPDAMGLAMPIIGAALGAIGFLFATWICVGHGGFDWISSIGPLAFLIATLGTLGVCLAAWFVLVGWMERMGAWVPPVGMVCGLLAPICLAGMLLICAWMPASDIVASPLPKVFAAVLGPIALAGLGVGAVVGTQLLRQSAARSRRRWEEAEAQDREIERKARRSPLEEVHETYAEMTDQSPLWTYVAALPDYTDAECRAFVVERSLKLPNLDEQLAGTINTDHPRYRHGCFDLIRFAPASAVKDAWAPAVEKAIRLSAKQIRENPDWLKEDYFSNPDPIEHLRAMEQAATRVGGGTGMTEALAELRKSIEAAADSPERSRAISSLSS